MLTTTYSNFRQNLKLFLDGVFNRHEPLIINRKNNEDLVVIAKSDYDAMEETFHLLKSSKNATMLQQSIDEIENGETTTFSLDQLKEMGE